MALIKTAWPISEIGQAVPCFHCHCGRGAGKSSRALRVFLPHVEQALNANKNQGQQTHSDASPP